MEIKEIVEQNFNLDLSQDEVTEEVIYQRCSTAIQNHCNEETGALKMICVYTLNNLLPLMAKLEEHKSSGVRAIVLSPTRELAMQTLRFAKDMAKFTNLRIISIVGGDGIEASWAGGEDGRVVIDKFLPMITSCSIIEFEPTTVPKPNLTFFWCLNIHETRYTSTISQVSTNSADYIISPVHIIF